MTRQLDSKAILKPAKFAHFVLRTKDLSASVEWYQQVVGMQVVFANDFAAFLTYDDEHHRLALIRTAVQESAPAGAAGLDHVAYTFNSLGELLSTYRRLEKLGIKPVWTINHGPTTSFSYADPDGNRVEFQIDNFSTEEQVQAFMDSEVFRANPIGVDFDAEQLVARYERGDPLEELIQQGSA